MRGQCPVVYSKPLPGAYHQIGFLAPGMAGTIRPGQFCHIRIEGQDTPKLRIPLSVYDIEGDVVVLMIRRIGSGTEKLCAVSPGDVLDVMAPLGNAFDIPTSGRLLLISGGVGYAALNLLHRKHTARCTWIHGGRTATDVFPADIVYTDDGSLGSRGFVTEGLRQVLGSDRFTGVYLCGPKPMLSAASAIISEFGADAQVSLEEYMACGIGVCHGCAVKIRDGDGWHYKTVCKDGPVFRTHEVIWDE